MKRTIRTHAAAAGFFWLMRSLASSGSRNGVVCLSVGMILGWCAPAIALVKSPDIFSARGVSLSRTIADSVSNTVPIHQASQASTSPDRTIWATCSATLILASGLRHSYASNPFNWIDRGQIARDGLIEDHELLTKYQSHLRSNQVYAPFDSLYCFSRPERGPDQASTNVVTIFNDFRPSISARPESGLQQFEQYQRTATTMTAGFSQSGPGDHSQSGRLSIKWPGKIRLDYQNGMLILGDEELVLIDPGSPPVRSPLSASMLSVLVDPNLGALRTARLIVDNEDQLQIEFHHQHRPQLGRITLSFTKTASAPGGLKLGGWTFVDSSGTVTRVRLSGHQYNASLADGAFRLPAPSRPQ